MVDVVRFAGGLLFDRVMAGWEAAVLTADHADSRPVQILGAAAGDLESVLASSEGVLRPEAIAVNADLCAFDARVRQMVQSALDEGSTDVRFWGKLAARSADHDPGDPSNLTELSNLDELGELGELDRAADPVQHRLSFAARAFKAHALEAAAAPFDSIDTVEIFSAAGRSESRERMAVRSQDPGDDGEF
jgi:hypothetical protein